MTTQGGKSLGDALRAALTAKRMTQRQLANALSLDPTQVNRWVNDKAIPRMMYLRQIEDVLGVDLTHLLTQDIGPDLYVSGPMAAVDSAVYARQRESSQAVVSAAREHLGGVYWPAERVGGVEDFDAPDLGTEVNLRRLHESQAFLYLQFEDAARPSSALVELGIALGMRKRTTVIVRSGLQQPYMIEGFSGVAARLGFLPETRIYAVDDVAEAVRLVRRNGPELFGLQSSPARLTTRESDRA